MDLSAFTLLEAKHLGLFYQGYYVRKIVLEQTNHFLNAVFSFPNPCFNPCLTETNLKILLRTSNTLEIEKNGKERSLTDRVSKIIGDNFLH